MRGAYVAVEASTGPASVQQFLSIICNMAATGAHRIATKADLLSMPETGEIRVMKAPEHTRIGKAAVAWPWDIAYRADRKNRGR
jgi:hypothetical protein